MKTDTKDKKRVPELCFPEFKKVGVWEEKKLGEIFEYEQPTKYLVENTNYSNKFKIPVLTAGKTFILGYTNEVNGVCTNLPVVIFDDFTTESKYVDFPFKVKSSAMKLLRCKKDFNIFFAFNLLKNIKYIVGVHERHWISRFTCISVNFPTLPEQEKIASCLSSLDELINGEIKKLEAYKLHKKGIMQKLFPKEGKKVPTLRFPEFKKVGVWEEKKLGDICKIVTGKTPNTSDESLWNGDIQFITPTDITESKYQIETQRMVVNNDRIKIIPKNSIMFTCIASIGKIAISVYPCITNQQINTLIPHDLYNNEYIYYALLKKSILIKSTLSNTTLPIINKTDFSKFTLIFPRDQKEQQKIASCLSSLDEKIEAHSNKIELLKKYKKGLMQKLFPKISS